MTRTQLLEAAARDLHILAGTQPLSASAQARLLEKYLSLHGELLADRLATWAAAEAIPAKCEEPLRMMLAARSVHLFGVAGDRRALLIAQGQYPAPAGQAPSPAETALRKAQATPYVSKTLETLYY